MNRKKFWTWIRLTLLCYGLIGIALYAAQDLILFQSKALPANHRYTFGLPYEEINLPYDKTRNLNIIRFPTAIPQKGIVVYLHGNRDNISHYARHAPNFTRLGYEVWMPDYPGYGKSTGDISEKVLLDYALQTYRIATRNCSADSIIIYGRSLGTGLATHLASRVDCRRLILETPYYSISSLIATYAPIYPVDRMVRIKIPSGEYVKAVKEPITIFQGTADWVIPYREAAKLKVCLKPGDEFITIDGGSHNDLDTYPLFRNKLDSLLQH